MCVQHPALRVAGMETIKLQEQKTLCSVLSSQFQRSKSKIGDSALCGYLYLIKIFTFWIYSKPFPHLKEPCPCPIRVSLAVKCNFDVPTESSLKLCCAGTDGGSLGLHCNPFQEGTTESSCCLWRVKVQGLQRSGRSSWGASCPLSQGHRVLSCFLRLQSRLQHHLASAGSISPECPWPSHFSPS